MDNTDSRTGMDVQTSQPRLIQRAVFYVRFVLRSFVFAFEGLVWMARTQRNAQVHLFITGIVLIAAVFFQVSMSEWLALILAIALVLALEAMNSAVEAVVDLSSPQLHPLAKRAKDAAAGSVLIAAIGAALVGCIVFLPKFWALLGTLLA